MFTEANSVEDFLLTRMTGLSWKYVHGSNVARTSKSGDRETVSPELFALLETAGEAK